MADGHPKFGGTDEVPVLDIGQIGGTRQGAGQALFTGYVFLGPDDARVVSHRRPQLNVVFQDLLGYGGRALTWMGVIKTDTVARLTTILNEINQRRHGSLRSSSTGVLGAVNMVMLRPTQLTDFNGDVMAARARLAGWRAVSRRYTPPNGAWGAIMQIAISFELLG